MMWHRAHNWPPPPNHLSKPPTVYRHIMNNNAAQIAMRITLLALHSLHRDKTLGTRVRTLYYLFMLIISIHYQWDLEKG